MPTPESEEIIFALVADLLQPDGGDPELRRLILVQNHAPNIDALVLKKISEKEEAWRRTLRAEQKAGVRLSRLAEEARQGQIQAEDEKRHLKNVSERLAAQVLELANLLRDIRNERIETPIWDRVVPRSVKDRVEEILRRVG